MERWIFVSREADKTDQAFRARAFERVDDPAFHEMPFGISSVRHLVYLPKVDMVGLEPSQRVLELTHCRLRIAAVRAHLGHQEDLLAPTIRQRFSHSDLALPFMVFPRIVHEGDSRID